MRPHHTFRGKYCWLKHSIGQQVRERRYIVVRTLSPSSNYEMLISCGCLTRESVTTNPPPGFLFLPFGECYYFFKDKPYLTPPIANSRKPIGAGASVVDSIFRTANNFSNTAGTDT